MFVISICYSNEMFYLFIGNYDFFIVMDIYYILKIGDIIFYFLKFGLGCMDKDNIMDYRNKFMFFVFIF